MKATPPAPASARTPGAVLEDLAVAVMSADPSDTVAVEGVIVLLDELGGLPGPTAEEARERAAALRADGRDVERRTGTLDATSEAIARMQDDLARAPQEPAPVAKRAALVLPEWGDERTLEDFLAAQRGSLDELEAAILGMERGDPDARASFQRRLHTTKGEAGVLGLEDLEKVAHAAESYLEAEAGSPELADRLFKVRDWMVSAIDAYARMCRPEPTADAFIASALVACTSSAPSPAAARVARDEETVGLFGEFLTESAEGLNQVERILMKVEREGGDRTAVDSLFRVFHTIKGTAGFLDLAEIVSLAHETEAMMSHCRDGALELKGQVVDLVFDSTTSLRDMLESVRVAIEGGTAIPARPGLSALVDRIRATADGAPSGEADGPPELRPAAPAIGIEAGAAPGPARAPDANGTTKLKETIKVDLERVDSLVEMIGELVVVESMVVNAPEILGASSVQVRNCLAQLAKVTRDLQDVGMHMRMVPVSGVFQKMARLVRDLARKSGKQVRLVTSGESTEVDRSMVENIADPLVHMIRNAMDHGLEPPDARMAAGKPPMGQIHLSAYHEGGSVVIEIEDDGRGLDQGAIVRKAIEKGLIESADGMSEAEINALIFAPGFSTAKAVTEISGRGVGMDVVKRNIESMRGRVLIESKRGAGTKFKIVLPLTLAIIDGMLVACGKERYIIPTLSIVESIQPTRAMLVSLATTNEMINLRGEILPLLRLDRLFGVTAAKADPTDALVVVLEGVGRRIGLLVDEVVTQQQVVIKSLGEALHSTQFVSGAAILSDGRVGLILNVEEIAATMQRSRDKSARPSALQEATA